MKHLTAAALIACALPLAASPVRAQVFGQFTGAETLPVNGHLFGAYLHGSSSTLGLLAQLRLSFYPGVDFGFHGGFSRIDFGSSNRTALRLGSDFKVAVAHAGANLPVDVGVGGAIGVETGDGFTVLSVGPTAVASRTYPLSGNLSLTPYASLGLIFSNLDLFHSSSTDLAFPLRLGADLKATPELHLIGELQFQLSDDYNDDLRFAAGVNLPF